MSGGFHCVQKFFWSFIWKYVFLVKWKAKYCLPFMQNTIKSAVSLTTQITSQISQLFFFSVVFVDFGEFLFLINSTMKNFTYCYILTEDVWNTSWKTTWGQPKPSDVKWSKREMLHLNNWRGFIWIMSGKFYRMKLLGKFLVNIYII